MEPPRTHSGAHSGKVEGSAAGLVAGPPQPPPDSVRGNEPARSRRAGHVAGSWSLTDIAWDAAAAVAVPAPPELNAAPSLLPVAIGGTAGGSACRGGQGAAKPPPAATSKKAARAPAAPGEVQCLVPGCTSDSSTWTVYSLRSRLCSAHMQSDELILPVGKRRFCQKCNRLHTLDRFEGTKRACIRQMESFNARRRANYAKRKEMERQGSGGGRATGKGASKEKVTTCTGGTGAVASADVGHPSWTGLLQGDVWSAAPADAAHGPLAGDPKGSDDDALLLPSVEDLLQEDLLGLPPASHTGSHMHPAGLAPLPLLLSGGDDGAPGIGVPPAWAPWPQHAGAAAQAQPAPGFWFWDADAVTTASVDLKLDNCTPLQLPDGLPDALADAFMLDLNNEALGGRVGGHTQPGPVLAMTTAPEPGCVLLTFEALVLVRSSLLQGGEGNGVDARGEANLGSGSAVAAWGCDSKLVVPAAMVPVTFTPSARVQNGCHTNGVQARHRLRPCTATAALGRLRSGDGPVGAFLRDGSIQPALAGSAGCGAAITDASGRVLEIPSGHWDVSPDGTAPVAMPIAACNPGKCSSSSSSTVTVRLPSAAHARAWTQHGIRARMHGHWLACQLLEGSADEGTVLVRLQCPGEQGVLMIEPATAPSSSAEDKEQPAMLRVRGPAVPVLMVNDEGIIAEVNATAARTDAASAKILRAALPIIGAALRDAATPAVRAHAAVACMRAGWRNAAQACLSGLAACTAPSDTTTFAHVLQNTSLLHEACGSGDAWMVDKCMQARATVLAFHNADAWADALFGAPWLPSAFQGGLTPLHVTALLPTLCDPERQADASRVAAMMATAMLRSPPQVKPGARQRDAARALVSWAYVRDASGRTPCSCATTEQLQGIDAAVRTALSFAKRLALRACDAAQMLEGRFLWPDTCACAAQHLQEEALRMDSVSSEQAFLIYVAVALLRDAGSLHATSVHPTSWLARALHASRRPYGVFDHDDVVAFENVWRFHIFSWHIHTFLLQSTMYAVASAIRWAGSDGLAAALRHLPLEPVLSQGPVSYAGLQTPVLRPLLPWPQLVQSGTVALILTQSLPLEAACVIALASIILYPPYTRWMRAPGTARVQLVLFTTALVQTVLVPALMHMRGNAIFLRTVGGYPQHPKRSALAMAAYTPFLFFCLPITPSAAAPLLLLRTVLPVLTWAHPPLAKWLWAVFVYEGVLLQIAGVLAAAAIVVIREQLLRRRFVKEAAAVSAALDEHLASGKRWKLE